jgi:hypothetical protein
MRSGLIFLTTALFLPFSAHAETATVTFSVGVTIVAACTPADRHCGSRRASRVHGPRQIGRTQRLTNDALTVRCGVCARSSQLAGVTDPGTN